MLNVQFTIEGVDKTVSNLNIYDMEKKKEAQKIVRSVTNKVARKARADVPVSPASRKKSAGQPGDLKKSITTKYYHGDLVSTIYPKIPKGAHRSIVTKGTKQRFTKSGKNRGRVKPQPFMQPAKDSQVGDFNSRMKKIWEDEVTEI